MASAGFEPANLGAKGHVIITEKKHQFISFDLDSVMGKLRPQSPRHLRDNIQRESHKPLRPTYFTHVIAATT